ncbi:MAG: hypothetical protein RR064_03745 [Oscillospiraceae bacterium]
MSKFLLQPNIPEKYVTLCCVAFGEEKIKKSLSDLSIEVIECKGSADIDLSIRNHSDINIHYLGNEDIICNNKLNELKKILLQKNFNVIKSQKSILSPYPDDISLNCFAINNMIFGNITNIDAEILHYYQNKSYSFINVNQGYAKCTTCIVDNNSVITSDIGSAQIYKKCGLDVLLIDSGDIDLQGYDYGFIGGCSGLISKNILAFTGDITKHKNWNKIKAFLSDRNVKYICLTDERLIDIGSIIPLKEID